jgi:hypothetical protein
MNRSTPRGIRNNNPGNVRKGKDRWTGLAPQQTDPDFCVFTSPEYGIRCLVKLLLTYQEKYGCDTVGKIISRWAPKSENDTGGYINHVAGSLGVRADQPLDLRDPTYMLAMLKAIILHENGQQPYSFETLKRGMELAGVFFEDAPVVEKQPPAAKPLAKSRTMTGIGLAGLGTVIEQVRPVIEPLLPFAADLKWAIVALIGAGLAYAAYARWDDHRNAVVGAG